MQQSHLEHCDVTDIVKPVRIFLKVNYNDIRSNVMSQSETNQNKRPIGHIAHLSNKKHDKISFMESFTVYLNNVVK